MDPRLQENRSTLILFEIWRVLRVEIPEYGASTTGSRKGLGL